MKIYNVGSDELGNWDLKDVEAQEDQFEWFVYDYQNGGYDGSGEAVALGKDGKLHCKNLGHCSCYGPMDGWPYSTEVVAVEDFFKTKDNVLDYDCKDAIKAKVAELLGLSLP